MRVKAYEIVARAVDEGVERGWNRAHKHTDDPDPWAIREIVLDCVMTELDEILSFGDSLDLF